MAVNKCNICGGEVDIHNGGAAILMAFCRNHATSLTNVSVCAECYERLLKDKTKAFADALCVELWDA